MTGTFCACNETVRPIVPANVNDADERIARNTKEASLEFSTAVGQQQTAGASTSTMQNRTAGEESLPSPAVSKIETP